MPTELDRYFTPKANASRKSGMEGKTAWLIHDRRTVNNMDDHADSIKMLAGLKGLKLEVFSHGNAARQALADVKEGKLNPPDAILADVMAGDMITGGTTPPEDGQRLLRDLSHPRFQKTVIGIYSVQNDINNAVKATLPRAQIVPKAELPETEIFNQLITGSSPQR